MAQKAPLWTREYLKAWTANFMLFFSFMLIAPLLPIYLSERFAAEKDVIGLVLSGYTCVAMMSRAVSGWMVDSFSRKVVLQIAYLLFSLCFLGYILAGTLLLFFVFRTMHGAPFGTTTVANSTVAIDVLHPQRRSEGIGYYGLSNNLATAISPTVGLLLYQHVGNFDLIFGLSFVVAASGFIIDSTIHLPEEVVSVRRHSRFSIRDIYLNRAWAEGVDIACYSFAYGLLSTYLAIYGKEELGITGGTGLFFAILSAGLVTSRLVGSRTLRRGRVVWNVGLGICVSFCGYLLFASVHSYAAYYATAFIIGFGNGHMFPAFQTMFVNLASPSHRGVANSSQLTSWDVGTGLGIVMGGLMADRYGYGAAFWLAWAVQAIGVLFFFTYVKGHYLHAKNEISGK